MSSKTANEFYAGLHEIEEALRALPAEAANRAWRSGGWTGKQIPGHMLDSAANNHQRFVRAATSKSYTGPGYEQQAWVDAHGYTEQSWTTLLRWWQVSHELLAGVVAHIPESHWQTPCQIDNSEAVTLEFVVRDYIRHQRHHLHQLQEPQS